MNATAVLMAGWGRQAQRVSLGAVAGFMVLAMSAPLAMADMSVRFIEGAPKDRFEITNLGPCASGQADLLIDLSGSAAGLIFDVTGSGAGVEVFQPFEIVSGAKALLRLPKVADGDKHLVLAIRDLPALGRIVFTIDVDDTIDQRGITVSGAEIEGARLSLTTAAGSMSTARFFSDGIATVKTASCAKP